MKKLLSTAIALLLVVTLAAPAFAAHGSHHGGKRTLSYSVCPTQSCTLTGQHTHSGRTYTAHYYGDGHKYHSYCDMEDCVLAGYHEHDGVYCFGHAENDGHCYHHISRGHHS